MVFRVQLLRSEVLVRLRPLKQLSVAHLHLHGELHRLHLHLHLHGELQLERSAAWDLAPLKTQDLAINRLNFLHQCFVPLHPLVKMWLSAAEYCQKKVKTIDLFF